MRTFGRVATTACRFAPACVATVDLQRHGSAGYGARSPSWSPVRTGLSVPPRRRPSRTGRFDAGRVVDRREARRLARGDVSEDPSTTVPAWLLDPSRCLQSTSSVESVVFRTDCKRQVYTSLRASMSTPPATIPIARTFERPFTDATSASCRPTSWPPCGQRELSVSWQAARRANRFRRTGGVSTRRTRPSGPS